MAHPYLPQLPRAPCGETPFDLTAEVPELAEESDGRTELTTSSADFRCSNREVLVLCALLGYDYAAWPSFRRPDRNRGVAGSGAATIAGELEEPDLEAQA